jgi:hypothetical protein
MVSLAAVRVISWLFGGPGLISTPTRDFLIKADAAVCPLMLSFVTFVRQPDNYGIVRNRRYLPTHQSNTDKKRIQPQRDLFWGNEANRHEILRGTAVQRWHILALGSVKLLATSHR